MIKKLGQPYTFLQISIKQVSVEGQDIDYYFDNFFFQITLITSQEETYARKKYISN